MKLPTQLRFLIPCLGWAALGLASCELAIGNSDLSGVQCDQPGKIGAPSCGEGQICAEGVCMACLTGEVCTNDVDDDCNGLIDDKCGGGGMDGGSSGKDGGNKPDVSATDGDTGVVPKGGAGGVAGNAGTGGSGGAAGQGGSAGSAGTPSGGSAGAAGSSGTGGVASGGAAGAGGTTGAGGSAGTGPVCIPNGSGCDVMNPTECCTKQCCLELKACGKSTDQGCDNNEDCCSGHCRPGMNGLVCWLF